MGTPGFCWICFCFCLHWLELFCNSLSQQLCHNMHEEAGPATAGPAAATATAMLVPATATATMGPGYLQAVAQEGSYNCCMKQNILLLPPCLLTPATAASCLLLLPQVVLPGPESACPTCQPRTFTLPSRTEPWHWAFYSCNGFASDADR